jgi:hypothetical protein
MSVRFAGRSLSCLGAMILAGCSSAGTSYRVMIDPGVSADDVTLAMARWQAAIPSLRLTATIAPCDWKDHTICISPGSLGGQTLGRTLYLYRSDRAVTLIDEGAVAKNCPGGSVVTIAHELGHAMALLHPKDWNGTEGEGTLMFPTCNVDRSGDVTATDVEQFWSWR